MSSVQDEAENGHAKLSVDEENEEEGNDESAGHENDDVASFGTLEEPIDRENEESSIRNGKDLHGLNSQQVKTQDQEPENSDLPNRAPERPSSADGSLSIPDDTPSIQVIISHIMFRAHLTNLLRAPWRRLQAEAHVYRALVEVLPLLYAPLIDVFRPDYLLLHCILHELHRLPSVVHILVMPLHRADLFKILPRRTPLRILGRL